jgi:anti-sigma factor RsiW
MTCDHCQSLIDDYVDGTLDPVSRKDVEAHLVDCDACRAMAEDFGAIHRTARDLDAHTPPPRVWAKLSDALDAERKRGWLSRLLGGGVPAWAPLAVTALILVIGGSVAWITWQQQSEPTQAPRVATAPQASPADHELVQSVETELKLAEEHYQKAIAGLEQITNAESSALDPQVSAVLQKNLAVIDDAIGESRAALQTQPTNEVAQESLFQALRNKVSLLQDTVMLINEMRKGNQEGAARVVSGLNQ